MRSTQRQYRSGRPCGAIVLSALLGYSFTAPTFAQEDMFGKWDGVMQWTAHDPENPASSVEIEAAHTILIPDGNVLFWGSKVVDPNDPDDLEDTALWNPNVPWDPQSPMDALTLVPTGLPGRKLFCAGHAHLADGRVLAMGGPSNWARIFDPNQENPWVVVPDMHEVRFYPTATTLPDGRVLVTAGTHLNACHTFHEVFDPDTEAWTMLDNEGAEKQLPWYPFMFVLEDGRVFFAGPYDLNPSSQSPCGTQAEPLTPAVLDPTDWEWQNLSFDDPLPQVGWGAENGASAVMYAPGKVVVAGGPDSQDGQFSTWLIDLTKQQSEWKWEAGPQMEHARDNADMVILADGRLLVIGGTCLAPDECSPPDECCPQLKPEWLDPNALDPQWDELAEMANPRPYHSTALLLPDARVLSAGADGQPDAQIFSPPHLFWGDRPEIECAPDQIHYGASFYLDIDEEADVAPGNIDAVNLVRLGAVTHAFDQNTRFVPLTDDPTVDGNGLYVPAPANANIAPPGHYMLFLISDAGVPSVAAIVQVTECPVGCPGDLNDDNTVDVFDLLDLLGCWGEVTDPSCESADLDENGSVEVFDLLALLAAWGSCDCDTECPPSTLNDCWNRYQGDTERYEKCAEWVAEREQYFPE